MIDDYVWNFSIFWEILLNTIDNILNTIWSVFTLVFTYLFYLRLKFESKLEWNSNIEEKNINKEVEL